MILTHYRELLALTQIYLHREYPRHAIKTMEPTAFAYFNKKPVPAISLQSNHQPKPAPLPSSQPLKMQAQPPPSFSPPASPKPPASAPIHIESATAAPPMKSEKKAAPPPLSPVPQKESKPPMHAKGLALEPFAAQASQDLSEFWKLHRQVLPEVPLHETIPADGVALKVKNSWLNDQTIPPVVILSFRGEEKELAFLKNVAHAISLRLAPARVISASKWEKENGWEGMTHSPNLRLIIASDYDLYLQPELMKVYREAPQQGKHYLNQTPLLLLSDISLYLKEPQLKSLLWRAICNEFAAPQNTTL